MRGTLTEVPAAPRALLHALELAREDLQKWCGSLTDEAFNARPASLPPVAFHLRHIARSLDRLLTYAEGRALTREQLSALREEMSQRQSRRGLRGAYFGTGKERRTRPRDGPRRSRAIANRRQKAFPTSVGGLLVHVADHTQRHVGQAITTAKILMAERAGTFALGQCSDILAHPEDALLEAIKTTLLFLSALFPIVNPLGGSPIFLTLTRDYTPP